VRLQCRRCGAPLTTELVPLREASRRCEEHGEPFVPPGTFLAGEGWWSVESDGWIAVHLDDVTNLETTEDVRRLAGCCGLDGMDGPNRTCRCRRAVATEKSDCWMPHAVLFDPAAVDLR
jgi:hypothetical protein